MLHQRRKHVVPHVRTCVTGELVWLGLECAPHLLEGVSAFEDRLRKVLGERLLPRMPVLQRPGDIVPVHEQSLEQHFFLQFAHARCLLVDCCAEIQCEL